MASPQDRQSMFSRLFVASYDHDPGATTAVVASPDGGTTKRVLDMSQYSHFGVLVTPTAMTGAGVTKVEIIASASSDMASPEVIKDSGTVAADALGDYVLLECSAEELAQEGADAGKELRYAAARITEANAADEAVVVYLAIPRHARKNLSATAIA